MKKYFIFLFVVLALALSCVSAFADEINPATEAFFTCDSNPTDFNGKTFENLYVLLNGCTNFDSTIIPGEDAFVTLRDITVTGILYYTDDTYDRAKDAYYSAAVGENLTHTDHYFNIAGESLINRMYVENIDPHVTNLGLDKSAVVADLFVIPTNTPSRGKVVIRGNIDPFVDEATDYYHDTKVASYPNFTDINTYDFQIAEVIRKDMMRFMEVTTIARTLGVNQKSMFYQSLKAMLNNGIITEEEFSTYYRGNVFRMTIYNEYNIDLESTEIDLNNLNIFSLGLEKLLHGVEISGRFVPILKSRGYTTIGSLISQLSFKTDADISDVYKAKGSDETKNVLPLYIDLLTIGIEGKSLTYDMGLTSVSMMNFLGNDVPGSKLKLTMGNVGDTYNSPQIGIANIIGGYFDWSCNQVYTDSNSIKKINFYEALDNYAWLNMEQIDMIEYTLYPWLTGEDNDIVLLQSDDKSNQELYTKRNDLFNQEMPIGEEFVNVLPKTTLGFFAISKCLDDYLHPGSVNKDGISAVGFSTTNVSFGEVNVSANLGSMKDWIDVNCHLYQNGVANSFSYSKIE